MDVINLLMCNAAVVLEDVVVLSPTCNSNLLGHRENFLQLVVRDIRQFSAMILRNDELA